MALHRMLAQGAKTELRLAAGLLEFYISQEQPGTYLPEDGSMQSTPWIHGGSLSSSHWRWQDGPWGPICLLCETCKEMGVALAHGWVVRSHYTPDLPLGRAPVQWLRRCAYLT